MPLPENARWRALDNWKRLVDAVEKPYPSLGEITSDLDPVSTSFDDDENDIYSILQVATEIEKEDRAASLALYEHALSLSKDLSKGRGILQFKIGLISRIKRESATTEARTSEARNKALMEYYNKHASYIRLQPETSEKVKMKRILRVLQAVLRSNRTDYKLPLKFDQKLDEDLDYLADSPPYNILPPLEGPRNLEILSLPEVIAAREELKVSIKGATDIFDCLEVEFGFQTSNLKNQREHLLLLLANTESQLFPDGPPSLHVETIDEVYDKTLNNYKRWCSYLGEVCVYDGSIPRVNKLRLVALYLCIWGEAANVRFLPECICFLFHRFAPQLNDLFMKDSIELFNEEKRDFLETEIVPIYQLLREEAKKGKNGKPHSKWRNYDDFNECFWSKSCLKEYTGSGKDHSENHKKDKDHSKMWRAVFKIQGKHHSENHEKDQKESQGNYQREKKVLFVEHRTFLHLYHSFVRVWILLFLMLQGLAVLAFTTERNINTLKLLLSLGPTFFVMKLIESVLDIVMMMGVHVICQRDAISRIITQFLFYGGGSGGIGYLYWKMLLEKPPSHFYLKIILWVLGSYATLKLIVSLSQRVPSVSKQMDKMNKYKMIAFLKWIYKDQFYVGRELYERPSDYIRYFGFWMMVLTCKLLFSYFLQILPLANASKTIFFSEVTVDYVWHDFVSKRNHNALALFFLWAPVILIYLLDIQIWYTVVSAIVGGVIGTKDRLGEISSLDMLQTRFESFPKAYINNLQHSRKVESTPEQASNLKDYAPFWNGIIDCMREEDYITNEEKDLLVMPLNDTGTKFVKWPLFLLASKVPLAMKLVEENPDALLDKVGDDKFMVSALKETYESAVTLLKEIVSDRRGVDFFDNIYAKVNETIKYNTIFFKTFQTSNIAVIHSQVTNLLTQLDKKTSVEILSDNEELKREVDDALKKIYEAVLQFLKPDQRKEFELSDPAKVFTNAKLPGKEKKQMIRRLHLLLTAKESGSSVPKNMEAQRRLEFFTNSLFMRMPEAPSVRAMKSFSVLTPYFEETVMFSLEDLHKENEDGITILFYLQKIFPDEWKNFIQRLNITEKALTDILQSGLDPEKALQTRLWASYRGQTLARTVRGMMYYRRALQLQAFMEASGTEEERKSRSEALVDLKFTYVVSCQRYGEQKISLDEKERQKAKDILYLLKVYEGLRIAFIHSVEAAGGEKTYYSKLVKIDEGGKDQVIYSIRLPGDPILGEGKPENQNHAIIFTRGGALQTIDMNQDNYFEEALKMRNLLEEFKADHGIHKPTILGVRENVFTGSVSSLAWFMSNQETSFVTLGQRVLARPLKVRMHYGHPDVFDRLFHLTRGGISKASRTINVSEDIFAGFNSTLRGGNITHHEYIQVGKGRDVGFNEIAMFEAKVSGGNGEQLLSRDVYRLGQLFDFPRVLSFYVTTVGYYACTMMTTLVVYIFLYGKAYLALSGVGLSLSSFAKYTKNQALQTALDTQFLFQIGIFTAFPMLVVFILEQGFFKAIYYFIVMQLQLCSVFFTFSLGTRSHYFGQTVLHGGAKYRETGRGFVVQHIKFAENYRLYSHSHFVKALEIVMLLLVIWAYGSYQSYALLSIFIWFLAMSWLFAPFIFNPSGFDWQKTVEDFDNWTNWLFNRGGVGLKADDSWETWWNEEQKSSGYISASLLKSLLSLRFMLFQFGVVYHLKVTRHNTDLAVYGFSWIVFLIFILIFLVFSFSPPSSVNYQMFLRLGQGIFFIIILTGLVVALVLRKITVGDVLASLLALIPTGWGFLSIGIAWKHLMKQLHLWRFVRDIAWYYDAGMGMLIFFPIAILSWFPFVSTFQTRLLFNQAFSRGLEISLILAGKRPEDQTSSA